MFHGKQEHNKNEFENFTSSYKKAYRHWMNSKIQIISKGKGRQIVAKKYSVKARLNLKTRFV